MAVAAQTVEIPGEPFNLIGVYTSPLVNEGADEHWRTVYALHDEFGSESGSHPVAYAESHPRDAEYRDKKGDLIARSRGTLITGVMMLGCTEEEKGVVYEKFIDLTLAFHETRVRFARWRAGKRVSELFSLQRSREEADSSSDYTFVGILTGF